MSRNPIDNGSPRASVPAQSPAGELRPSPRRAPDPPERGAPDPNPPWPVPRAPTVMREAAEEPALIRRALDGDRGAFDALVRAHFLRVYALLFHMTGNHEDAEDLAQECFVRAWVSLAFFRGESSFATWLQRIALHLAQDFHRARGRRGTGASLADEDVAHDLAPGDVVAVARAEDTSRGEIVTELARALDRLPPRLRAAIVLRTLEEQEYPDVARSLGVKPATARMHVMQARKLLLRWLAPWLGGPDGPHRTGGPR